MSGGQQNARARIEFYGTITLDLVALPEPPLMVKRRKILTVERADDQPRL